MNGIEPHPSPKTTPLPWNKVSLVGLILLGNSFSIAMVFPFLPFMVHDFFPELNPSQVGYAVGFLASAFCGGMLVASYFWGELSDRIGRKPVLLCGLLGTTVAIIVFGLSQSFVLALVARFMWGLLNGNISVARTYLSEILDDTNLGQGFAVIGLQAGIGRLLGPALGGLLANSAEKFKFLNIALLRQYPYLLPCLIAAIMASTAFIGTVIFLEETLKKANEEKPDLAINESENWESPMAVLSPIPRNNPLKSADFQHIMANHEQTKTNNSLCSILRNRKVIISCTMYGVVAAVDIMSNEIFALWALNDAAHGGFSFNSQNIGMVYMISAPFEIFFQLFGYAGALRYLGSPLKTLQASLLLQASCHFILPFTSFTANYAWWVKWVVLITIFSINMIAGLGSFTSVFILISNSAVRAKRGRVNGIGQSMASLSRVVGPPLASCLFAWSEGNRLGFPMNYHFVYNIITIIAISGYFTSRLLPESINRVPEE